MNHLLLQLWGKTPKPGEPPERFHPAIYHMLDVAFVAEALLRQGSPRLRQVLLHAWAGCDPDALLDWLPFLVATHDLGKLSAPFQGQTTRPESRDQRERLERLGVSFGAAPTRSLYHAEISAVWLHEHLALREPGTPRRLIWAIRDAMGGHHGRFTESRMADIGARLARYERGASPWAAWRNDAYSLLKNYLAPTGELRSLGEPQRLRPATVALTGFIILSDWLGSNSDSFPASAEVDLPSYLDLSRRRAAAAIEWAGLQHTRSAACDNSFATLFPHEPRPLQRAVDELSPSDLAGPLLAVIEAPTGEGKTEAALALARRLAALSGQDELFFALPTMATGNQMFKRLTRFYDRLYGAAVRLTHSQEAIVQEDLRRAALASDYDDADPRAASTAAALHWFAGSKKALLAPFGVGTVDQVELGGLNVRHYALRLFALAGKVVVIDEIHAYDAYMSTILDHTLAWLASLGASVILLSATLPSSRQQALAASYLRGLNPDAPPPELPSDLPYPMLAVYRPTGTTRIFPAAFRPAQRFTLRLRPQMDAAAEARRLLELVAAGGAVARICNRVDDAQAIYRELLGALPADSRVLLHARFPLDERQQREARIEQMVGHESARKPDQPLIIVGTQVLEQSLDYDVDVMVSDFAPIDLLLQRAGRLHRHHRTRPPHHVEPQLEVVLPLNDVHLPVWERWAPIYSPYVLWRTWEVIGARMVSDACLIALPGDYRALIEAVYATTPQITSGLPQTLAVARAWERHARATAEQSAQARRPLAPDVAGGAIIEAADHHFVEDDEEHLARTPVAKTRLGDRITVVPLYHVDGRIALDPLGTFTLDPNTPPQLDDRYGLSQKELVARGIPISDPKIIAAYRDEQRLRTLRWPWPDLPPLLRSLHPLILDRAGTAVLDRRLVRLDPELGLVIEKEEL